MNTPQEMIEVCEAIRDGKEVEFEHVPGCWYKSDSYPNFGAWDYRVKPIPIPKLKRVPLGPEDFPPGTVVRREEWGDLEWRCIVGCGSKRVSMPGGSFLTFNEMDSDRWFRLLPGTTEWLPCYKEVEA